MKRERSIMKFSNELIKGLPLDISSMTVESEKIIALSTILSDYIANIENVVVKIDKSETIEEKQQNSNLLSYELSRIIMLLTILNREITDSAENIYSIADKYDC